MAYVGVVVSFGTQKGYGFINSEQVEGDVFFGKQALPPELHGAADFFPLKGKTVQFELKPAEPGSGKPCASSMRLMVAEGEACVGTVKTFNAVKGFGFLGSSSVEGSDFFFAKRDVPPQLQGVNLQGQVASFTVVQTPEGKLQARGLTFKGAPPAGGMQPGMMQQPMMPPHMGGAIVGMQQRRPPAQAPGPRPGGDSMMPQDGQRYQGTVHNFNFEKGFGFIKSPSIPADVYFKGQGEVFQPGMSVAFSLRMTPDGKPQANNVTMGLSDGQSVVATVSSYSPRNGYGFFTIPDGLGDVYFKKTMVPPEMQEADLKGMHASVSIRMTQDGKAQCVSASFLDGPPPGYIPPSAPAAPGKRMAPGGGAIVPMGMGGGPPGGMPPHMQMGPPQKRMRMEKGGCNGGAGASQATGVVASFNAMKGFGFISCPAAGRDVYFKRDSMPVHMQQQPLEGTPVSFGLVFTPDGKPQAQNVQLAA